jgi:hypothetical protein
MFAVTPGDFRPIAMVHSFDKLVSKILALRLAPFMPCLVSTNQTAFMRKRSILDSYKYVQCAAAVFRRRKIPKLLLKLDISKAFDSLAWSFLLEILLKLGFSTRWCNWISVLLSTASSRILLNGVLGHRSHIAEGCARGMPSLHFSSSSPWRFLTSCSARRTMPGSLDHLVRQLSNSDAASMQMT